MEAGLLYDPGDPELIKEQTGYQMKLQEMNMLRQDQAEELQRYIRELFAECGEEVFIQLPFYANWGGHHVHLGSHIYANYNFTCVDDGHIYIGDWTQFGPNVTIATAGHAVLPELREGRALQFNKDVHIGRCVWVGANVTICPGVTIGDNSVIGAGSVVTKDIPANVVAVGNPCKVTRKIGDCDREYFYKDEKIDWSEIQRRYY